MSVQQRATYNLAHGLLLGQETSLSVTSSSNHHKISTRWWIKCCQGPVEALLTIILKQRLWGRTHFSLNIGLFLSFFFFLALLLDMQDLSSPTRDQTQLPGKSSWIVSYQTISSPNTLMLLTLREQMLAKSPGFLGEQRLIQNVSFMYSNWWSI